MNMNSNDNGEKFKAADKKFPDTGKFSFGEKLKELRMERGLGQVELANELSVSKGTISFWENDMREPGLSNLVAIANFFDVSIDFLVGREK